MTRAALIGRLTYHRHKGDAWLAILRAWILPVMGSAGVTKYLGWPVWTSVVFWIGFAVACETAAILIGWWEHKSGATAAHYGLAAATDPYKSESLRLMEEQAALLREIQAILIRADRVLR